MFSALCLTTTVMFLPWITVLVDPAADSNGNAALKYWQAFATLPKFTDAESVIISDCLVSPLDETTQEVLKNSKYSLTMLHRASAIKHCEWGMSFNEDGVYVLLPHVAASRQLTSLACLRARQRFQFDHDSNGAVEDVLAAMTLGRHISVDGSLIAVLVGYNIEYRAIETLAVALPKLDSKTIKGVRTRFDAMPSFGNEATALLACEKVTMEWFIRKVQQTKDKEELLTLFAWIGISEDKNVDSGGKAARFLEECGGTAEGVVKFAVDALPSYDKMAKHLILPLDAFEREFKRDGIEHASNPVYNVFFPALEKARQANARAEVRRALFSAALAVQLDGQNALTTHLDPIVGDRFDYTPFKMGFELSSKMKGPDGKPLSLSIGRRE